MDKKVLHSQKRKKLKIGIDIDNVIADTFTSYLERFNREFNLTIQYEELIDFYYLEKRSGIELTKVNIFLDKVLRDEQFQLAHKPYTDATKVIRKWLNRGFSIYYITARPTFARKITYQWLKQHGFTGKGATLYLYDSKGIYKTDVEYKKALSEKLKLDVFIEDAVIFAKALTVPVFLIDRPWNRTNDFPKNVTRVKNWQEIDEKIKYL